MYYCTKDKPITFLLKPKSESNSHTFLMCKFLTSKSHNVLWQIFQLSPMHMLFQDRFLDKFGIHILLKLYNVFLREMESQSKMSRNT